jgi:hypothetical protein
LMALASASCGAVEPPRNSLSARTGGFVTVELHTAYCTLPREVVGVSRYETG